MKLGATEGCRAAAVGVFLTLLLACEGPPQRPLETRVHRGEAIAAAEAYCSWFADERDGVLYFGEAPFWSAFRASGGNPSADAERGGPLPIGRFDVQAESFDERLVLQTGGSPSGVWDVLAHPNGWLYYTTFFSESGRYHPETGAIERFPSAGLGLNELSLRPDGRILATRYAAGGGPGSVATLTADGQLLAEHPLGAPEGHLAAPKSVAFDPVRREIWVNADLLPLASGDVRRDTRVLDESGHELLRFEAPEVQFMVFDGEGTGYFAEVHGELLSLRIRRAEQAASALLTGRIVPLDDRFAARSDFVQEVRVRGGRAVVTRWSGRVHVVEAEGPARTYDLPRDTEGLYYTGVLVGDRLCVTQCSGVTVACLDLR